MSQQPQCKHANENAKTKQLCSYTVDNESLQGKHITTDFGVKVSSTDDSLKAGERGPTLIEDFNFRIKMTHFDHERIPERVVHARGSAAHGYFQVYEPQGSVTKAKFLNDPARRTPVFVRFSTVLGSKGSADTVRDVRGFATRFYTEEGNFDIVGNNIPVFFIQDAMKFPDVVHAAKPEPNNEMPQAGTAHDNAWDFFSLQPETLHMTMWALSDRAIPRSYRMMQGFGVNTYTLINAKGERHFVKFHWIPKLGVHSLVWDEAQKIAGQNSDFHRKDLWEAIESGSFPEWELGLQYFDEKKAEEFDFDPLDATKLVPEELVPIKRVGRMVLNRNPDNFFAETEQVAFCVQNVVPGIGFSDDPLLQGRLFSYHDTQLIRLGGPNFNEIPINLPVCPYLNQNRDGHHRMRIDKGKINYFPNRLETFAVATEEEGAYVDYPEKIAGIKNRLRSPKFKEHFNQARLFYHSLTPVEQKHLIEAGGFELGKVEDFGVRQRMINLFNEVDHEMATAIADKIGIPPPPAVKPPPPTNPAKSPPLSQEFYSPKDTIASRKVAILIADGFDDESVKLIKTVLTEGGAMPVLVAPARGAVKGASGKEETAEQSFSTAKSTIFDAVYVPGGQSAEKLGKMGVAVHFVNEAMFHFKPVAASGVGVKLLSLQCASAGIKVSDNNKELSDQGIVTQHERGEHWGFQTQFVEAIKQHRFFTRDVSMIPA